MTNATHIWTILGVTRFTPAPNAPSYLSSVNWMLHTTINSRVATRTDFTTFGPDYPGSEDLDLPQLLDLIRSPEVEAELEAELAPIIEAERTYAAPFPLEIPPAPAPQTSEIPVVEEAISSTDTPTPAPPASKRNRARTKKGHFVADNPATPENEAWTPQ